MDAPGDRAFGPLLRRYRLAAGLTHEELAERARLSARAISALERGERLRPRPATVRLLAAALGLDRAQAGGFLRASQPAAPAAPVNVVVGLTPDEAMASPSCADATPRTNPPFPMTSFVGRERELEALRPLLFTARLLTLTGPGGVGKTRLAVRLAARVADDFLDGVAFVSLAELRDADLVLPTTARAFGVLPDRREPGEALAELLHSRRLLLVLDNCEQVAAAAPALGALLAACPRLTILATSRAPLRLAAEQEFPVPPLAVPPDDAPTPQALVAVEAAALFVARARAVRPDFAVTAENAAAVAALCRRLDGLPLALELAAVRTRILSPAALLDRLKTRLDLLAFGPADAPARQRTLRATLGWSHDLLRPDERALFRLLGVFVGGFTAAAAEAVGATPGDDGAGVLDRLSALVAHGLVHRDDADGEDGRFGMLETIREYARGHLEASGEGAAAARAHARHFLALAERAHAERAGPRMAAWLDRLDRDHDNLRAALAWCEAAGEAELGLRLAAALFRFWSTRGPLAEGRAWLDRLLAAAPAAGASGPATAVRATALLAAGVLAYNQGDLPAARALADASLALRRPLGDAGAIAEALNFAGR
ncbi:MAG TPA: helix-turn-helix domain-containing protein, partial [Thermomicrobiales bacterium]|nr:helix-turn-helix domain-containing protein [Thermomicrobiales bacterium]